jgi:hypothetical protein
VTAGPVHWGSYDGDFLEKVMAVLVAQDHPNTIRRTPSSGDGGVDLLIPADGGYEVEQVKGFTGRLDDGRKRQVKDSWDALVKPRLDRPIVAWRLVVPIDPTSGEQVWFNKLVAGAPFPCEWRGEVHWHNLASKHPHVIDYYLEGGRERVARRAEALLGAATDPRQPLTAVDVASRLEMLQSALMRDDPHYRYDFMTTATRPGVDDLPPCALARTTSLDDGGFLTIVVVAKHLYADRDSPIGGSMTITVAGEDAVTQFQEAWQGFAMYGRALELPDGSITVNVDAPGGLGVSGQVGGGWLGPSRIEDFPERGRVAIDDPNGARLVELPVTVSATRGSLGGAEVTLEHPSGTMRVALQLLPPGPDTTTVMSHFEAGGFSNRPVDEVIEVVRFMAVCTQPNTFVWLDQYGLREWMRGRVDQDHQMPGWLVDALEDLQTVQTRARQAVTVPEEFDRDFVVELHGYARMLRGEEIAGTWSGTTLTLRADADPQEVAESISDGGVLVHEQEVSVTIGGQEIPLGKVQTVLSSARVDGDIGATARLVPADDNTMMRRIIGSPSEDA